jgi:hypothetical protein
MGLGGASSRVWTLPRTEPRLLRLPTCSLVVTPAQLNKVPTKQDSFKYNIRNLILNQSWHRFFFGGGPQFWNIRGILIHFVLQWVITVQLQRKCKHIFSKCSAIMHNYAKAERTKVKPKCLMTLYSAGGSLATKLFCCASCAA